LGICEVEISIEYVIEEDIVSEIRKLSEDACENFDTDYLGNREFEMICECINASFPNGKFRFLDIGGGNGNFSDKLLSKFPNCNCVLIDNSEVLINKNFINERKKMIFASFEKIFDYCTEGEFDIVFCNWVLHHFVGNSYMASHQNIVNGLCIMNKLVSPKGGFIIINENLCVGIISDKLSSRLIYTISSSKLLEPVARRFGSNSAGCGVCYLFLEEWKRLFNKFDLPLVESIVKEKELGKGFGKKTKLVFLLKNLYEGCFILRKITE